MTLQCKNVTITHTKDLRTLVEDFSFSLAPGDRAAIIGEEGNGKSTLLRVMAGEMPPYTEVTGEVIRRGIFGYLSQEADPQDLARTVYEFFCEDASFFDVSPAEVAKTAGELGVSPEEVYSDRLLQSYSGGERVKLRLLRVLLARPEVLLLDEPSNDLDMETLVWLERFILQCPQPVVYISHDEVLLERTANVIIHLEQVKKKQQPRATVARLDYRSYVERRAGSIERQTQLSQSEHRAFNEKMEKYRQIQQKVEHQQNAISRGDPHGGRLLKKKMANVMAMGRRFEKERENLTEMPLFEEAMFLGMDEDIALPAGKTVLDIDLPQLAVQGKMLAQGVRLHIAGPEKLCIVGKNGAGKSTLLREMYRSLQGREDITVGYMPQDYSEVLDMDATPVEFLAPRGDRETVTAVRTCLGSMKYTHEEMLHPIRGLSGGQKAKLLLLKLKQQRADVLLLDEPTRNFSPLSGPVVRELIASFGGAVISISHDRKYIYEVCDRILRLTPRGLEPVYDFEEDMER